MSHRVNGPCSKGCAPVVPLVARWSEPVQTRAPSSSRRATARMRGIGRKDHRPLGDRDSVRAARDCPLLAPGHGHGRRGPWRERAHRETGRVGRQERCRPGERLPSPSRARSLRSRPGRRAICAAASDASMHAVAERFPAAISAARDVASFKVEDLRTVRRRQSARRTLRRRSSPAWLPSAGSPQPAPCRQHRSAHCRHAS
jgi:hypothetical protein